MCGDGSLAADVADEAFTRALERWDQVPAMDAPEAWTYTTAVNVLRRLGRRAALERRLLPRSTLAATGSPSGWDLDVLAAIGRLPRRQRTAVALHYVGDLSIDDTAAVMGIRPGTVLATVHAARSKLAKALGHDQQEASP